MEAEGLPVTDENVFITATCLDKGIAFLKGEATRNVRKEVAVEARRDEPAQYAVTLDGATRHVTIDGDRVSVGGRAFTVAVAATSEDSAGADHARGPAAPARSPAASAPGCVDGDGADTPIEAPLPGVVVRINTNAGDTVRCGDALLVLEAMKMETEISSPMDGTVQTVTVTPGEQVQNGQVLVTLR